MYLGAMSEKLIRCRKELSAAITRASSQLQDAQPSAPHMLERPGPIEPQHSPSGRPSILSQPAESVRLMPTKRQFPETVCNRHICVRKPLSNIENVLHLHNNPPSVSEELQPLLQDAENLPRDPSPQDITRDLLDIIENTSSPVMKEISRTLEWDPDISRDPEEILSLTLDDTNSPAGGVTEPAPGDDQMIEMVLDLEDDYSTIKSYFIL
ncbi:uncharacterized protein C3orf62 homolog [Mixophyes fleayi]|uniref:uncharacterized protein C3orf62 homolog n=1 Tax=Mixophyes fleayi TaxID=3061075 RepID=UPI003F4DC975